MNAPLHAADARREFESLLKAARRRLHCASLAAVAPKAARRSLQAGTAAGWLLLAWQTVTHLMGGASPVRIGLLVGMAASTLPALLTLARVVTRAPSWRETAERVDLAAESRNRVANALALLEADIRTPFATTAVLDGLWCLRQIHDVQPIRPRAELDPRALGRLGVACLIPVVALTWFGWHVRNTAVSQKTEQLRQPLSVVVSEAANPLLKQSAQQPPHTNEQDVAGESGREHGSAATTEVHRLDLKMLALAMRAKGTQSSAQSPGKGDAGFGRSTQAISTDQVRNASPTRRNRELLLSNKSEGRNPNIPRDVARMSALSGRGNSGANATHAMQTDDSKAAVTSAASVEDDADVFDGADEPEDPSTQRGGARPLLKDRQAAPSRELGISSNDSGEPGTSRGGPTPPKKSRGTASVVLGAPISDVVRGHLGPGPSRVTLERIDPIPSSGELHGTGEVAARSRPEPLRGQFSVPCEFAEVARSYLVALHGADSPAAQPTNRQQDKRRHDDPGGQ